MISIEFPNAARILAGLERLTDAQIKSIGRNVYQEAEVIMTASKQQVPIRFGALRSTGHVELPDYSQPGKVEVKLGYGGVAVGYAVIVHEDLKARHKVGNAKYLERPLHAAIGDLEKAILAGLEDGAKDSLG